MNAEELVRLYRRVGAVIALIRFNYRRGFRVRAQYAPHNIPVRTNIVSQLIALDSTIPKEPPLRKNCFQTTEFVFKNDMYDYGCVNRALGSFRLVLTYRQARRFGIRRIYFVILTVLAMSPTAFGQANSSDSQTLQALLTEVRELRQVLQVSLTRIQSAQIL